MPVHEDCLSRIFFEFLRPFVRGTPTTHSEGLPLRVGALPCAPTYNRGVVQHVVFNRLGLAQPHECSSKAAIYHANSSATSSNNLYRGRNCCTTHASKATYRYFLGTRLRLPRRVTLERVPTDWYFLFCACGVDMLPPRPSPLRHRPSPLRHRPSPLRHSHPVGIEILLITFSDSQSGFSNRVGLLEILLENVLLEKAFSDSIRSGFLVPYQKSRFLKTFSNSIIRSGLTANFPIQTF